MGKRCTYCQHWCDDKEFGLSIRMRNINGLDEGEITKGKVASLQSWCKACTNRYKRLKRGTGSDLDILTDLSIRLDNDFSNDLKAYPKQNPNPKNPNIKDLTS